MPAHVTITLFRVETRLGTSDHPSKLANWREYYRRWWCRPSVPNINVLLVCAWCCLSSSLEGFSKQAFLSWRTTILLGRQLENTNIFVHIPVCKPTLITNSLEGGMPMEVSFVNLITMEISNCQYRHWREFDKNNYGKTNCFARLEWLKVCYIQVSKIPQ